MKALTGRLIVKEINNERTTTSGIIVGDSKSDKFLKVEVVSCGGDFNNGKKTIRKPCNDGDIVYMRKPTKQPVYICGFKCHLITFQDVLAVNDNCRVVHKLSTSC